MDTIEQIFVIGGTGAQGLPIVQALAEHYFVRVLTRDIDSARAKQLSQLPGVELVQGSITDQEIISAALRDCQGAFINIDGFSIGQKNELFWGTRIYELAREAGVKFFVWGNLDYVYKKAGYDPKFRCGHYDGKGLVGEWILAQPNDVMGAALFTTGPYLDMVIAKGTPMAPKVIDGVVTWAVPLGQGAVPHIALSDCGKYVLWLFANRQRANGMDLEAATEHVNYTNLAAAFSKVTGKPAQYIDTDAEEYFDRLGPLGSKFKVGASFSGGDDVSMMSWRENFRGFWNMFKFSGDNKGVIKRDYALLDEILPERIRSAEEWFRGLDIDLWESVQPGTIKPIIKLEEDMAAKRLTAKAIL